MAVQISTCKTQHMVPLVLRNSCLAQTLCDGAHMHSHKQCLQGIYPAQQQQQNDHCAMDRCRRRMMSRADRACTHPLCLPHNCCAASAEFDQPSRHLNRPLLPHQPAQRHRSGWAPSKRKHAHEPLTNHTRSQQASALRSRLHRPQANILKSSAHEQQLLTLLVLLGPSTLAMAGISSHQAAKAVESAKHRRLPQTLATHLTCKGRPHHLIVRPQHD
jgi:hypothetical protein